MADEQPTEGGGDLEKFQDVMFTLIRLLYTDFANHVPPGTVITDRHEQDVLLSNIGVLYEAALTYKQIVTEMRGEKPKGWGVGDSDSFNAGDDIKP